MACAFFYAVSCRYLSVCVLFWMVWRVFVPKIDLPQVDILSGITLIKIDIMCWSLLYRYVWASALMSLCEYECARFSFGGGFEHPRQRASAATSIRGNFGRSRLWMAATIHDFNNIIIFIIIFTCVREDFHWSFYEEFFLLNIAL